MDYETLRVAQEYLSIIFPGILAVVLYSYIYYLYSSEKKGVKNYEKYGKIALDDNIDSEPVEKYSAYEKEKMRKEENKGEK